MNPQADTTCAGCGAPLGKDVLGGVCAACFARGALLPEGGWLQSLQAGDEEAQPWPELPDWQILGVLGAGGMGTVFRAQRRADGIIAALKVLDGRWSRDPLMSARFEAEADALKRLEHPNIVRVLETCEAHDGRLCIVMELVDGCDLGRLLRAGPLGTARSLEIFQKVCAAVVFAHARGFSHRDIKPANILVTGDDGVKLADFGLAKECTEGTIGALTATTDQFGTAYYLAPERMISRSPDGPPQDVYALGVLLYHLLAGRMPIGNYTPVSRLAPVPAAFDALIAKALEADPARRIESADALGQAIAKAWRAHENSGQRRQNARRLLLVAAAGALGAGLLLSGAAWQRSRVPERPVFTPPSAVKAGSHWENSLGMRFVPVPGTRVLFSIWETRRRDVEPFIAVEKATVATSYREVEAERSRKSFNIQTLGPGGRLIAAGSWAEPGFPVTDDHPACFMLPRDGARFCQWLTWKEQAEGRLLPGQCYRLPTAEEWLIAAGGEDTPPRAGNVAGPEARDEFWNPRWPTFDKADAFPRMAPVGSFPAELHGLFDISGNVSEWVLRSEADIIKPSWETDALLLGPDFHDGSADVASFRHRRPSPMNLRLPNFGFRIVLEHEITKAP